MESQESSNGAADNHAERARAAAYLNGSMSPLSDLTARSSAGSRIDSQGEEVRPRAEDRGQEDVGDESVML